MLLTVNATSGASWCCWCLCKKITEKASFVEYRQHDALSFVEYRQHDALSLKQRTFRVFVVSNIEQLQMAAVWKNISPVLSKSPPCECRSEQQLTTCLETLINKHDWSILFVVACLTDIFHEVSARATLIQVWYNVLGFM